MMKKHHHTEELLDQLGEEALRAFRASDEEIAQTAAAPFLYRRIQAHIAERRQAEERNLWFVLLGGLRRALPAFALLALLAMGGAFFAGSNPPETLAIRSVPAAGEENLPFESDEEQLMSVIYPGQSGTAAERKRK